MMRIVSETTLRNEVRHKIPVIHAKAGPADVAPGAHAAWASARRAVRGRQARRVLQVLSKTDPVGFSRRRRALAGGAGGRRLVGVLQHFVPAPGLFQLVLAAEGVGGRGHGDPRRRRRIVIVVGVQFVDPGQVALLVGVRQRDNGRPSTGAPSPKSTRSTHSQGVTWRPDKVFDVIFMSLFFTVLHFYSATASLILREDNWHPGIDEGFI